MLEIRRREMLILGDGRYSSVEDVCTVQGHHQQCLQFTSIMPPVYSTVYTLFVVCVLVCSSPCFRVAILQQCNNSNVKVAAGARG